MLRSARCPTAFSRLRKDYHNKWTFILLVLGEAILKEISVKVAFLVPAGPLKVARRFIAGYGSNQPPSQRDG